MMYLEIDSGGVYGIMKFLSTPVGAKTFTCFLSSFILIPFWSVIYIRYFFMKQNFDAPPVAPDTGRDSLAQSPEARNAAFQYMQQNAESLHLDRLADLMNSLSAGNSDALTADAFATALREQGLRADLESFEHGLRRIVAAQRIAEALMSDSDRSLLDLNGSDFRFDLNGSDLHRLDADDVDAVMRLLADLAGDRVTSHVGTYHIPNADNGWDSVDVAVGEEKPHDEESYLASSHMSLSSSNGGEVELHAYYTQSQLGDIWASTAADIEEHTRLAAEKNNS